MGQINLKGKEKLHCARCDEDFGNQVAYLEMFDGKGGVVKEVLCLDCSKVEHSPQEQSKISMDSIDFGKMVFDLIELGTLIGKEGANGNRTNPAKSASRT